MRNQLQKIFGIFIVLLVFSMNVRALNPTFQVEIKNDAQIAPNQYIFDVYVKSTSFVYEQMGFQAGFFVNNAVLNGGVIKPTIVSGFSDLVSAAQQTNANLSMAGTGTSYGIKMTGTTVSGQGNGTMIGLTEMRICRILLTNQVSATDATPVNFTTGSHMNLSWSFVNTPWKTKLNAYVTTNGGVSYTLTDISIGATSSFVTTNYVNPALNVSNVPTVFAISGGGSYCAGVAQSGINLTLANSETAYTYQLFKGGVAEGTPVAGTGAAITWSNLTAGVYTVEATDASNTPMTGSVTVTELPSPAKPVVSVVNNCDGTSTLTIDNSASGATFTWTGGLAATNPTTASTGGSYTVTQTAGGCTSMASDAAIAAPKQTPATPIASVMDNCGNSEFSISNLESGATLTWYDGANAVHIGNNYSVNNSVTLTAKQVKDGCTSLASNAVTSTPITAVTPAVSIAADLNNVCAGTTVVFTPTPVNGGATPAYEWFVGAVTQGSSATFSYVPANGDVVSCILTSAESCVTAATATSNAVTMTVNAPVTPSVSILADLNNVCAGTTVTYTSTPVNGGANPIYQWKVNGFVSGGLSSFSYMPSNGDVVSLVLTSDLSCVTTSIATSNEITMNVTTAVTPSVSIAADLNNVCAGTTVVFTPTPVNGGATPAYEWFVGAATQGSSATFSYIPANGDVVSCIMTSAESCVTAATATSNAVTMTVNAPVTPAVTLVSNVNNVCAGTNVTFTATPTVGGSTDYAWYVNGFYSNNGPTNSFSFTPFNGDVVSCIITSDLTCVTSATAASNNVIMTVNALVTPSVTIAPDANNVCAGTTVTLTATPVNGGVPSYQWVVNGVNAGTLVTYSYVPSNGDVVYCEMTSTATCASPVMATSADVNMVVNPLVTPSVSIVSDLNNVCAGTNVTYTATPVNGGNPVYQWKVNGNNVGTNMATYAYMPANGDVVTCEMTSDLACVTSATVSSNSINMIINAIPSTPVISQNADCNSATLSTTAAGNLMWSTGATTSSIVVGNGTYTLNTTVNGCISANASITVTLPAPMIQAVTIVSSANPSNQYANVTYTATVVPSTAGQTFAWYVNGVQQINFTASTFVYTAAVDGDIVYCMALPTGCYLGGTSNSVTQNVTTVYLTNTWLGNSNVWNSAANWSLNAVPLSNHDVIIPSAVANFPIIAAPAVCHNITIENAAQLINNSTLAIGGMVKVKQLLTASKWHFMSSPISNAKALAFSNANPNNAGQNLYLQKYNESWDGLSGSPWYDVIDGNLEIMSAGKGYEAWSDNNHVVTMEGTQLNSASVTIPLSWSSPNIFLKGYNLVGNPFPSALNVNNSNTWPLANVIPALYLWSAGFGNYLTWDGALTGSIGGVIAANQSFFVVANGPAASYTIPATAKTFGGTFHKSTVNDRLTLDVKGNNYQDQATIRFDANATSNYDSQFDVKKIFGLDEAPQFYSVIQNEILSINALPSLTGVVVVPMALKVGANGTYTITASEMNSFANGTTIMLEDTKTNTFTNLNQQSVYTFTANVADNANRFKVHFGVNGINENNNGNISIYSNKNVIYVNNNSKETVKEIVVMNMLGQQILSKKAANSTVNTITMDVATAYYVVKVVTANKVYTEKVYVK